MARKKAYNPEKRTWRGKSYKKGGKRVQELRADRETLPVTRIRANVATRWCPACSLRGRRRRANHVSERGGWLCFLHHVAAMRGRLIAPMRRVDRTNELALQTLARHETQRNKQKE